MRYEKIAESIIASAVKTHLRQQIKEHCRLAAKSKAKAWLRKNKKSLEDAIGLQVDKVLNAQKETVIKAAASAISLRSPIKRGY